MLPLASRLRAERFPGSVVEQAPACSLARIIFLLITTLAATFSPPTTTIAANSRRQPKRRRGLIHHFVGGRARAPSKRLLAVPENSARAQTLIFSNLPKPSEAEQRRVLANRNKIKIKWILLWRFCELQRSLATATAAACATRFSGLGGSRIDLRAAPPFASAAAAERNSVVAAGREAAEC